MKEEWSPIAGYEQSYEVSDAGRVRSMGRVLKLSNGRTKTIPTVVLKQATAPNGYQKISLYKSGSKTTASVHRLVLEAFVGPPQAGQECRHVDGDKGNNDAGNLAWGTPLDNYQDRVMHGSSVRGTQNPRCVLNREKVASIRRRLASGESQLEIARSFGVSKSCVSDISTRRTWRYTSQEH